MKQHQGTDAANVDKEKKSNSQGNKVRQSQEHKSPTQMPLEKEEGTADESNIKEDNLVQIVDKLQQELAILNDKYLRLYAEFENFKKRVAQERLALIETASEKILQQILPIIDDFERALEALHQKNVSVAAVEEGVELIHHKMLHVLEQAGVQPMKLEKGSSFNPELHEAITKTPVIDPALKGTVIDIVEKGYLLKNTVLRYAKVIIGE